MLINPGGFILCLLCSLIPASNTRCDPTAARSPAPPQTQGLEEGQRAPPGLPTHRGVPAQCTLGPRLWNQEQSCIPCCHAAPIAAGLGQCLLELCWKDGWRATSAGRSQALPQPRPSAATPVLSYGIIHERSAAPRAGQAPLSASHQTETLLIPPGMGRAPGRALCHSCQQSMGRTDVDHWFSYHRIIES